MANAFQTPTAYASEGLAILENEMVLGNKVSVDYSDDFAMIGDTLNIRRQTAYSGQSNNIDLTGVREDITEGKMTIQMNKTLSLGVDLGAVDATLNFDRWSEEVVRPVMVKFKDAIDASLASLYTQLYWFTGTPGTVPATYAALGATSAMMTDAGIPTDQRSGIHGPTAAWTLADGLKTTYVQGKVKTALELNQIGRYANFENYECVSVPTHTVGVATGTPTVNGAAQNVTYAAAKDSWSQSLITTAWTASTANILKAGDIINVTGVFSVNPVNKVSTGRLQPFTVLADATSAAAGATTLTISPPIITSGAYQTVSAAPANGAAIVVKTGTGGVGYQQSLMLHKNCLMLATRPLKVMDGAGIKTSVKTGNRVSIRATEYTNGDTLKHTMRFDMLWGIACDPRLGARLTN